MAQRHQPPVQVVNDTQDCSVEKPFTIQASPETQALKEQQAKELAPKSGQSKILRKAREKMLEESRRKHFVQAGVPAGQARAGPTGEAGQMQPLPAAVGAPPLLGNQQSVQPSYEAAVSGSPECPAPPSGTGSTAEKEIDQGPPPTPRLHEISRDYEQEFPEVQVGPRVTRRRSHGMENIDLDNEEMDSDEEWQQLIEATDPSALQLSTPLTLLRDQSFQERVQARLGDSSTQVLEGMLEGASRLRPVLRVIGNLLATRCDWDLLHAFCQHLQLPQFLLTILGQMLHSEMIRQQPWCVKVLSDLLAVLAAYFSSNFDTEPSGTSCGLQVFEQSAKQFLRLLEILLSSATERELSLREQSITCLTCICETMDRSPPSVSRTFYSHLLSTHQRILATLLQGTHVDTPALQHPEGPQKEQWERLTATHTAALAAMCTITPGAIGCGDAKQQIAEHISNYVFAADSMPRRTRFIKGIQQPALCLSTLKVLYSCCQISEITCQLVVEEALDSLLQLLCCKLTVEDGILPMTQELTLHLLTVLVIQLDQVPESLEQKIEIITSIFLQSPAPTHTCAAAFLIIQLCSRGSPVEIQGEDFLRSVHSVLLSCPQTSVSVPMDLGKFDGLFTLLLQYVNEGEPSMLRDFADSELWNTAWHCLAQVLHLSPDRPVMEGETPRPGQPSPVPDWSTLSPSGIVTFLGLATLVLSAAPHQCLQLLASPRGVVPATLGQLLSESFLRHLDQRLELPAVGLAARCCGAGVEVTQDVVLRVCQLLCFPFAMDVEEPMFTEILRTLLGGEFVQHLVQLTLGERLPAPRVEMPLGLLWRLTLSGSAFVDQFVGAGCERPGAWARCLRELLQQEPGAGGEAQAELLLALLVQVCRCSARYRAFVEAAAAALGSGGEGAGPLERALQHPEAGLRRRACSLAARLLLGPDPGPVPLGAVLPLLGDPEPGVREAACFAVGNAAYSGVCAGALSPALPTLLGLLSDPNPRTRRHACSALHNLCAGSPRPALGRLLLSAAAPQRLLQLAAPATASHNTAPQRQPAPVREAALAALRALARWPLIREVLISLNSCEKLSLIVQETEQSDTDSPRNTNRSILHHCHRLLETLSASPSD
ncbi:serine/threonine-protein kinase 36 isoform X2 [Stegostoma tigrinum]|uniref:serine/threonine-protein kinase 36 isoform X2 n=1 Tax=Stegostoma tigrinum TaxID=3053191 RepID=UPI002870488D|nr:serine/threonine-protein kinase 36 isoform X2 [Stegostoma tigrinum]